MPAALNDLVRTVRRAAEADRLVAESDAALLDRLHPAWDAAAFEALVRRHARTVLAACRSVLRDDADVQDAFQATFLVLLRNSKSVRRSSLLGRWLYGVARKVALKAKARAAAAGKREAKAAKCEHQPSADPGWRETCDLLHRELARLPVTFRRPLELCYLDGLTRDETAAALGVTVGTVKGRLERGRTLLRERLERRGVSLSVGLLALALTNSAAAVSPRVVAAVLSAASGSASPTVAALAEGFVVNGTRKTLSLLAVVAAGVLGIGGWVASNASATPDDKPAAKADAKDEARKPEAKERTITGKVVGSDGKPVAAELSMIWIDGKPEPLGKTNAAGRFKVTVPMHRGEYGYGGWLTAKALAHGIDFRLHGQDYDPTTMTATAEVTLTLPKERPIKGRLIDQQGKPVAGAKVVARDISAFGSDADADRVLLKWAEGYHGNAARGRVP